MYLDQIGIEFISLYGGRVPLHKFKRMERVLCKDKRRMESRRGDLYIGREKQLDARKETNV